MASKVHKRGVLYLVWGRGKSKKIDENLRRSTASVFKQHPELHVTVKDLPEGTTLLDKPKMYELSPYEETLFLDADTEVLGKLDFGFESAARHGLACAICEAGLACRYSKSIQGDLIEYNTGVLFFRKSEVNAALFVKWGELAKSIDSSVRFMMPGGMQTMPYNDQAAFAKAVHELGVCPFVLPHNWNYRYRWQPCVFGPVKVWHDWDPVMPELRAYWERQARGDVALDFARINLQT